MRRHRVVGELIWTGVSPHLYLADLDRTDWETLCDHLVVAMKIVIYERLRTCARRVLNGVLEGFQSAEMVHARIDELLATDIRFVSSHIERKVPFREKCQT
jgi:hypothetical protein